jgi:hypothetical protein
MITALSASTVAPAIFVRIAFSDEVMNIWSGIGSIAWNGETWLGVGTLMAISTPEDSSQLEAKGITLSFAGIDATLLPQALNNITLGTPVTVYLGLYDDIGALIDGPVIAWSGRMDQPTFDVSATEVTLAINCENKLLDMNVPVDRRYTNQDLQMEHPGDLGLMFVDGLQECTIYWGTSPITTANV